MAAIDIQNARQIRDPMVVTCGIAAKANVALSVSDITGFALSDTNAATSIKQGEWPIKQITDLQGEGFPLDGTCELYTVAAGSEEGKLGLRTHIGGSGSFTISSTQEIPSLTIYTAGEGTLTAGGTEYELRGVNVIPVNATSIQLTFESSDEERRVEVQTVIAGINLSWDQETLISCEINLRSDLSIEGPQLPVSEIEIRAYYPDDISEAVSGISDNVPIWHRAGYPGDMSPERRFYLSEPVTMESNIITIKGRDAAYKLGDKSHAAQILNTTSGNGRRKLYRQMANYIKEAGITLRSKEAEPDVTSGTTERSLIFKAGSVDSIIADIMNLAHTGTFWPTFVDAGIPKLWHTKPDPDNPKWTIREEDCADVSRSVDRNIAKIRTTDDFGLHTTVERSDDWKEIARRHVERGVRYSQNAGGYFWMFSVSNAVDVSPTAESVWWTAKENTMGVPRMEYRINNKGEIDPSYSTMYINECIIKGKAASVKMIADNVAASPARAGVTATISPIAYGRVFSEGVHLYPNYNYLFRRSNITGEFTWKGDPRMQPRDTFRFIRLDGTAEVCTIESIALKHEEGGTTAVISYRLGVC